MEISIPRATETFALKLKLWPRTIRYQLLVGLVLLEALSLALFGIILLRQQQKSIHLRTEQRLAHQADSLTLQAIEGFMSDSPEIEVARSVRMMGDAPSVASAKVTDPAGKILFLNEGDPRATTLVPEELARITSFESGSNPDRAQVFKFGDGLWESVKPIRMQGKLYGFAWIETEKRWDEEQLKATLTTISIFGLVWMGASLLLGLGLARSITRPLEVLHRGTRALMQSPEDSAPFPLAVVGSNEIADLIVAFNRMVASIEEQRGGLRDTLSLLDSMLANAPIGLAFFDRQSRFVRVNRIFSEATGLPLSRHLGRTLPEVLPAPVAFQLEQTVQAVFAKNLPIRDIEVTGPADAGERPWTWIASAYPVHTLPGEVRWVGLIVMDASERKLSEEALRKTEKLAATGRLAASIAHEINNPLEAITNLLYLLSNHADLAEPALGYAQMAEHEVRRISEITQQTLRFYRQSTLPARTNLAELLDSVFTLHQSRLRNLGIQVARRYDPKIDLYCFAGELRQVFANLVGNAIDAMPDGGRLSVRARRSQDWAAPGCSGVRFQVSDTGSGIALAVQKRIFEPFFTTKDITGTGLGLWVSSELVAKHKGTIRVRSHVSRDGEASGTVFELFFPEDVDLTSAPDVSSQISAQVPV